VSRTLIPFLDSESWFVEKQKKSCDLVALFHWDPFVLYIVYKCMWSRQQTENRSGGFYWVCKWHMMHYDGEGQISCFVLHWWIWVSSTTLLSFSSKIRSLKCWFLVEPGRYCKGLCLAASHLGGQCSEPGQSVWNLYWTGTSFSASCCLRGVEISLNIEGLHMTLIVCLITKWRQFPPAWPVGEEQAVAVLL
jgi:hypothetical protein